MDKQLKEEQTKSLTERFKILNQHDVNLLIISIILICLIIDFLVPSSVFTSLKVFPSTGISNTTFLELLPLRVALAFVFIWYSINNLQHPEVFNNITNIVLTKLKLEKEKSNFTKLSYIQAILEFIVGISLLTGIYMDIFSLTGAILLFGVLFAYEEGLGSLLIRDIGLLGGMMTIFVITISKIAI